MPAAPVGIRERPSAPVAGPLAWLRMNLFSSWLSSALTLLLGYLIIRYAISFIDWSFINAIWSVPTRADGRPDSSPCMAAKGVGACWAVIGDKWRFILFGYYPYDQQWRPAIAMLLFVGLYGLSADRRMWRRELAYVWIGTLVVIGVLMWGGVFGLTYVPQEQWGGLPLTLILATFGLAFAFPLAVLVALGRRARSLPAVKTLCIVYVELIRGVPLISLLFMASVMFPLFLPNGLNIDKLLRAQIAIILFAAAYLAEVVRGGLQALPKGQYEAADALGLSYWQKTGLIILPQALRLVIPPLVNTFIGFFKDTSLVLIIGLLDLLTAGKTAVADATWQAFATEVYVLLAVIYFLFCFAMSRYSRSLEAEFDRARTR
ncbi:MAG: amino acid ABC transporter permease [Acetobacteraceae bacterium]|nr:amino acid ABC transporter permease [Acetobacteraceae bacterium]